MTPIPVDVMEWALWFESHNKERIVQQTTLSDGVFVSTVFLGIDHNFFEKGPPILFETMVFGGAFDQEMERYSTWEQAEVGHRQMLYRLGYTDGVDDEHEGNG